MLHKTLTWKEAVAILLFALGLTIILSQPFSSSSVGPVPGRIQGCYRLGDQQLQLGETSATIHPEPRGEVEAALNADNQGLFIATQPMLRLTQDGARVGLSLEGGRATLLRIRSEAAEELYAYDQQGRLITMPRVECDMSLR